jgi:hypothetical protein
MSIVFHATVDSNAAEREFLLKCGFVLAAAQDIICRTIGGRRETIPPCLLFTIDEHQIFPAGSTDTPI